MSKRNPNSMLVFALDEQRFALPYTVVIRVIRAIEISPIPNAPTGILGIINLHGDLIPVIDIRQRLGFEKKEIQIEDYIVIVHIQKHYFSFVVQDVFFGEFQPSSIDTTDILANNNDVEKIIKDSHGMIHLLNADKLIDSSMFSEVCNNKQKNALGEKK